MPADFYRAEQPPKIGTKKAQPPPQPQFATATPTTPAHPPRPLITALPKPVQEPPAPATLKHPLPQPAQQGPPNKQVRSKEVSGGPDENPIAPMSSSPAVDLEKVGAPTPKDPPVSVMPTPPEVQAAQPSASCAAAAQPSQDVQMTRGSVLKEMQQTFQGPMTSRGVPMATVRESFVQKPKIQYFHSPSDINWDFPLQDQLEPQFYGGPDSKKSKEELRVLRNRIPKLDEKGFKAIFPGEDQSTVCVVQKTHARHYIHLQSATTWIINATHWFNALQQSMMFVICRRDWEDASKLQYLMQILQVTLEDYIPKWQIFVESRDHPKEHHPLAESNDNLGRTSSIGLHGGYLSR